MPNLPLYPSTPFTDGDLYTPELAYLAHYTPIFDDQPQYLGHREKLTDDELSDAATAIKSRVAAIEGGFRVTSTGGLTLAYASGTCVLPNGETLAVAQGTLAAPDNATSYVWIDPGGNVACGLTPPVYRSLLAKVIAATGSVSQVLDFRSAAFRSILPVARSIKSFGGSSLTDFTATAGTTLDQGVYYFRNFTVPAGVTLNVTGIVKIYCQTFTCGGTVQVSAIAPGGIRQGYVISSLGSSGGSPGQGLGATGAEYGYGAQSYGSGGQQGLLISPSAVNWGFTWAAGFGGGCFWVESSGAVSITGTIVARGTDGGQGGTIASGNTQGGTQAGATAYISGSGGGSGGLIYLASLTSVTVSATATLDVRGGNGGNGFSQGGTGNFAVSGGHGGGGGYLVISSPSNNTTGSTLLINAGTPGNPAFVGTASGNSTAFTVPGGAGGGVHQGGIGGSFGGVTSFYSIVNTGGNSVATLVNGTNGRLVLNNFIPIA